MNINEQLQQLNAICQRDNYTRTELDTIFNLVRDIVNFLLQYQNPLLHYLKIIKDMFENQNANIAISPNFYNFANGLNLHEIKEFHYAIIIDNNVIKEYHLVHLFKTPIQNAPNVSILDFIKIAYHAGHVMWGLSKYPEYVQEFITNNHVLESSRYLD